MRKRRKEYLSGFSTANQTKYAKMISPFAVHNSAFSLIYWGGNTCMMTTASEHDQL